MYISTIILRFLLVFLMSLAFGLQRQRSHKPTGFGTFIFVAIGACGLALTAENLSLNSSIGILSAIITSIGFLGAGALIKTSDKIFGFTTAAGIWTFAIIGLTIGIGEYIIGILIYIFVWFVVIGDIYLEKEGIGSYQKKITVHTKDVVDEETIRKAIRSPKQKLLAIELDKENNSMSFSYLIEGSGDELKQILSKLKKYDWFKSYKLE